MADTKFKPGSKRPAGAGMKPGQITKKVEHRNKEHSRLIERLHTLTEELAGKTVQQICDAMGYNPIVANILFALDETTPVATRQKYNESILARVVPTLAKEDIKVDNLTRVVFEGYGFQEPAPIEAQVVPSIVNAPDPTMGLVVDDEPTKAYNGDKSS